MEEKRPAVSLPPLEKLSLTRMQRPKSCPSLLTLPAEIVEHILQYLPDISLYAVSLTCKRMQHFAHSDNLWHSLLSRLKLTSPHPYPSYRRLHRALAPHLFLPRKLFLGDREVYGHMLVSKYLPLSGTIEAFALIEDKPRSRPSSSSPWSQDPEVRVYSFEPKVRLWEETELKISPDSRRSYSGEIPQPRAARGILATFIRAKALVGGDIRPNMKLWPPDTIPSVERIATGAAGSTLASLNNVDSTGPAGKLTPFDSPPESSRRSEREKWMIRQPIKTGYASEKSFRLRKWTMLGNQQHLPYGSSERLRVGEKVETYSEVDEELWTPTPEYPYRGIWIGDYAMHGTEFLLFHQPPKESPTGPSEIHAIKLTGDPNVKRGECSFAVWDVTPSSAIRTASQHEVEWPNALVYDAAGIATRGIDPNGDNAWHELEFIVPENQELKDETEAPTYQLPGGLRHPSSSSSSTTSLASIARRRSSAEGERGRGDIGAGWGVGREERRSAPSSAAMKYVSERLERRMAPWVKREVVVWWKGNALYDMRRFKRVDVDDFFD